MVCLRNNNHDRATHPKSVGKQEFVKILFEWNRFYSVQIRKKLMRGLFTGESIFWNFSLLLDQSPIAGPEAKSILGTLSELPPIPGKPYLFTPFDNLRAHHKKFFPRIQHCDAGKALLFKALLRAESEVIRSGTRDLKLVRQGLEL
jgi:hypothetical protein